MRCTLENWHLEPQRRWMEDDVNRIKFCFSIGWFFRFQLFIFQGVIQRYSKTISPSIRRHASSFWGRSAGWNSFRSGGGMESSSHSYLRRFCFRWMECKYQLQCMKNPENVGESRLHQNFLSNLFGRKWFCWKCWGNKRLSLSQTEADQWHGRLTGNIERKTKKSQGKGVMPFEMWNARAFDLGMIIKIGGVTSDRMKWALEQARPQHFATLSLAQAWSSNIATTVSWRSVPVPLEILKVEAS